MYICACMYVQASTPEEHQAVDKIIDKGKLESGLINRATILSESVRTYMYLCIDLPMQGRSES